jgi:serine/threonine-protein phosphatase 4 regulatory subunit 1
LACSIHELARILGPTITNEDLVDVLDKFLKDSHPEVRLGALKNLHIFLNEVESANRQKYMHFVNVQRSGQRLAY